MRRDRIATFDAADAANGFAAGLKVQSPEADGEFPVRTIKYSLVSSLVCHETIPQRPACEFAVFPNDP